MSDAYGRPELLVETEWLAAHLDDPGLRIVDADHPQSYARAHIPGAVGHLSDNVYLKTAPGETFVMGPDQYAETVGRMGIGDDTAVVVYDGSSSLLAARFWWTLRYYGHTNVRLLNGGWHAWLLERRAMTMEVPKVGPARFTPRVNEGIHATCDVVRAGVGQDDVALLDVRNRNEYTGENSRGNRRSGNVPGAVHLEWTDFMTPDARKVFKPAPELRSLLRERGVTPDKRVHVY